MVDRLVRLLRIFSPYAPVHTVTSAPTHPCYAALRTHMLITSRMLFPAGNAPSGAHGTHRIHETGALPSPEL